MTRDRRSSASRDGSTHGGAYTTVSQVSTRVLVVLINTCKVQPAWCVKVFVYVAHTTHGKRSSIISVLCYDR